MKPEHAFLAPLLEKGSDALVLRNRRTGGVVASQLEPAFDSETRRRGLLGRDGLAPGAALLIAPCSSVHTFFMRFPIDLIFVDKSGTVMKTYLAIPSGRIAFAWRGFVAIELPAGTLSGVPVRVGDRLDIGPSETPPGA